jgi:hypothetical protein
MNYLVSTDSDLTDVDETTAELRKLTHPIKVGSFLRGVMGWSNEELTRIERRQWSDIEHPFWEVN